MWVVVHVFAGLAVAALVKEPVWLVAVLAFGSHVPLDVIPHWDYTVSRHPIAWGWADFLAGLATLLVCLFALGMPWWLVAMGPLSGAPDFDVLVAAIRGGEARHWFPSHWKSFPHGQAGPVSGIAVQAVIVALCVAAILAGRPY
jgi:hypothetical protein